jgi:hypothetical protein
VDRITSLLWRLRRLGRVEAGIFAHEFFAELADRAEREARAQESSRLEDVMAVVDTIIGDEDKHREALQRAQEMRVKQDAENTVLGRTFARDADSTNAFSKLSRYEAAIERGSTRPCTNSSACRPLAPPRAASRRLWQWTLTSPEFLGVIAESLALFRKNRRTPVASDPEASDTRDV